MARPTRKPIYSNQLNKRIDVWGILKKENELGEAENQTTKLKTVWAAIVPQYGSMSKRVGTEFAAMTHKVIVRYSAAKDIKNTYHFVFSGKRYDILYQLNPYEGNETIEFFTREIVE